MQREEILDLPNGRRLHFASTGNPKSTCVVLFFSGIMSIGTATESSIPKTLSRLNPHWIAPTIPGNGQSSSTPTNVPYNVNICTTITALLKHLYPDDNNIQHIILAGGSYGTVMPQMLFGAPISQFPYSPKIRGMLLLSPFSPFREHPNYPKGMIWSNWLSVGPPSQILPFRLVPRLISMALSSYCKSEAGALKLLDVASFSKMNNEERQQFSSYAESKRGMSADELKLEMASNVLKCAENWDGYIEVADVLHSDWGFRIAELDNKSPVLIVHSERDPLGPGMAEWLAGRYASAELKIVPGGHGSALYYQDEIWERFLEKTAIVSTTASDTSNQRL